MKQEIQERINGYIEYLKKNDSDVEIYVEPKDNVRIMKQALDGYCISIPAIAEYTDNLGDGWLTTTFLWYLFIIAKNVVNFLRRLNDRCLHIKKNTKSFVKCSIHFT